MKRNSALTTETCNNLLLDAGVVFVGYGTTGERILGATNGGNTYKVTQEVREIELDGKYGDKYKKLKRILSRDAEMTVNLKEITAENLKMALVGSTDTGSVAGTIYGDYLGVGTTQSSGFTAFTATKKPLNGTVKFNLNGTRQDWKQGVDFALTTGSTDNVNIKANLITSTQAISASYTYLTTSTASHYDLISKGTIEDTEYQNITLVAPRSGSTELVMCYLKNALAEGEFELGMNDKDETTIPITFHAHWTATMKSTECPFGIKYPK